MIIFREHSIFSFLWNLSENWWNNIDLKVYFRFEFITCNLSKSINPHLSCTSKNHACKCYLAGPVFRISTCCCQHKSSSNRGKETLSESPEFHSCCQHESSSNRGNEPLSEKVHCNCQTFISLSHFKLVREQDLLCACFLLSLITNLVFSIITS